MSPTKHNSSKNVIENISLSPKPTQGLAKSKNNVTSSNSKWKILAQAIRKSANVSASTSQEDKNNDLNPKKLNWKGECCDNTYQKQNKITTKYVSQTWKLFCRDQIASVTGSKNRG